MASHLLQFNPLCRNLLGNIFKQTVGQIRTATKKKSGTVRLKKACGGRHSNFGLKFKDGDNVKAGSTLFIQNRLYYLPGLNVGVSAVPHLHSKVDGKVYITCEKTKFDSENRLVKFNFPSLQPVYKHYIHVIPKSQHQVFKLVEKF